MVSSPESWREQERAKDSGVRNALRQGRNEVPMVKNSHRVLGFGQLRDQYGGLIVGPLVTDMIDETLFAELMMLGLDGADARHLMYAVWNGCDRFLTLDLDFLDRRAALEGRCPSLRIVKPSELVSELPAS